MGRFGVNREFAECGDCGHPRMAHFGGGCYCGCAGAFATAEPNPTNPSASMQPPDVVDALQARVSAVKCDGRDPWELLTEAARLREAGRPEEALAVARRAVELADTPAEQTAGATVVTASLCDLWRDEEARCEGEAALKIESSPYLLRAVGRAWHLGFAATGVEEFRSRAHECFRAADEIEAVAA